MSPSFHASWGRWAPPMERSTLVSFHMSGASVGTCVTLLLGALVTDLYGWEVVFYYTGILIWFHQLYTTHLYPKYSPAVASVLMQVCGHWSPCYIAYSGCRSSRDS